MACRNRLRSLIMFYDAFFTTRHIAPPRGCLASNTVNDITASTVVLRIVGMGQDHMCFESSPDVMLSEPTRAQAVTDCCDEPEKRAQGQLLLTESLMCEASFASHKHHKRISAWNTFSVSHHIDSSNKFLHISLFEWHSMIAVPFDQHRRLLITILVHHSLM